jgi:hypothetical protein
MEFYSQLWYRKSWMAPVHGRSIRPASFVNEREFSLWYNVEVLKTFYKNVG